MFHTPRSPVVATTSTACAPPRTAHCSGHTTAPADVASERGNPFDAMVGECAQWLCGQTLPNLDAEELLHHDLTPEQRRWLSDFILRWDALDDAEQVAA